MIDLLISMESLWDGFMGLLGAMMQPLYWAVSGILVGFHSLLSTFMNPNDGWTWTLSIILLTVVIRTALIPLFVRQIRSSRAMQMLGPQMKELQAKYGHDRERLGQETMKLYREEGVSPTASCLPLLLQMPIFIALYYVLSSTSTGVALGWFFEQNPALVASLKNAQILGASISAKFWPIEGAFGNVQILTAILIVAMTGILFVTQLQLMRKNMPPEAMTGQMAQQQKLMLYMFPAMYLFMGISIPVGVLLYWLTSNTWTMGQQWILIHNNPAPNTPAYIDWADRMRAKGLDPDALAAQRAGKGRSPRKPVAGADTSRVVRQGSAAAADSGPVRQRMAGGAESSAKPGPSDLSTTSPQLGTTETRAGDRREVVRQPVARQDAARQQPQKKARSKRKS